jgi:hypothetical protein
MADAAPVNHPASGAQGILRLRAIGVQCGDIFSSGGAMKRLGAVAAVLVAAMIISTAPARAAVQTRGSEQLGKVWIGVHPLGVVAFFDNEDSLYKFGFNVLGHIADASRLSFWLGGELNLAGEANYALIEPGLVFQITFEKMIPIPLVPHARFGLAGGIDNYYGSYGAGPGGLCVAPGGGFVPCNNYSYTAGDFWAKFGGGVHYFIIRQIGLGVDTDFALGGFFYKDAAGNHRSQFRGYWDLLAGAVFTF